MNEKQVVITFPVGFEGRFSGRIEGGLVTIQTPDGQPEPTVELVAPTLPSDAEVQRVNQILKRLAEFRDETRDEVYDTYRVLLEAGARFTPPKRGARPFLWVRLGKVTLGFNSATLHLGLDNNSEEALDLAESLPGAVRSHQRRVNLSRRPEDLRVAVEKFAQL